MADRKTRPVLTPENLRVAFMVQFDEMSDFQQRCIITALEAINMAKRNRTVAALASNPEAMRLFNESTAEELKSMKEIGD